MAHALEDEDASLGTPIFACEYSPPGCCPSGEHCRTNAASYPGFSAQGAVCSCVCKLQFASLTCRDRDQSFGRSASLVQLGRFSDL